MSSMDVGLWRADAAGLWRLKATGLALESRLEDYIEADPMLLGEQLLIIGRQVQTAHGKRIDLLALDVDGAVHVVELKRDKTERDVVAQTLDYGSWVSGLGRDDLVAIYDAYRKSDREFEEAFAETFGDSPVPEEWNESQVLTVVASTVDPATDRIVRYLNEGFGVPINVAFFRHFEDRGASYFARTLLVPPDPEAVATRKPTGKRTREPWNGHDWYVSFGDDETRSWTDARRYGFVSAGGGKWYSQTLQNLPLGARVFVYVPKIGYVGVGLVTGSAEPFDDVEVTVDGEPRNLAELDLVDTYRHQAGGDTDDVAEYVVPVEWLSTVDFGQALRGGGLFASQHSACKLRHQFTIAKVTDAFGINDADLS